MLFQKISNRINPKTLFLIDSLGALLSAFLLGVVLVRFESVFGMPRKALYFLSSIACVFAVYSFSCFLRLSENWRPYLKIIAVANLLYCGLTLVLVVYLYQRLAILGLLYFIVELIIVSILAIFEWRTAANLI